MKNKLLSGVASFAGLALLNGYGLAADLPLKAARFAPAAAPIGWSGPYIGGHVMWGDGDFKSDLVAPSVKKNYTNTLNLSGLGVGLHAGYNWQMSQWVFGIEGDVTATPWENSNTIISPSGKKQTASERASLSYLSTIRGRLGVAFDRTLIYATGGVAFAQTNFQSVQNSGKGSTTFGGRKFVTGAVAGGGIEHKYNSNLSVRLEGLYYFLDDKTTDTVKVDANKGNTTLTHGLDDIAVVRVGASWHF